MEYKVLGPIEVWDHGVRLPLAAAKQRALLALGVLNVGRVISAEAIVDALWEDPPATASGLVQSYVSALRRLLHRDGVADVIVTRAPGYLFRVEPAAVDVHQFESLLSGGRAAAAAGRHSEASELLCSALALWRGPAFGGVASPVLQSRAIRLEEARLTAQEERLAADLELGRAAELVPELLGLVADHPLRERLRGQLMLALYRIGRQADALATYRRGADILSEELGLDPGAELQALQAAILRNDDRLNPAAGGAGEVPAPPAPERALTASRADASAAPPLPAPRAVPAATPGRGAPAQLPAAIADLTGRDDEVARVRAALTSGRVCAISGKAGGGKSALALYVADAMQADFPAGQLYVNLRGAGPAAEAADVLAGFLRALGVPHADIPDGLDQRAGLYRSVLAGRRVLVVLDDAASARQVRPLLPSRSKSAVLVTSRASLYELDDAVQLSLDVLDPDSAVRLLGAVAGHERVAAEPDAAREIAQLCGYLPLALRTAAARLAARRQWKLAVLASRLRDEHRRLDELAVGDLEVRASLELSYRELTPVQQRAFRLLGVLGAPDFAPWVLAPLQDLGLAAAEQLVEQLADAQLLDLAGSGGAGSGGAGSGGAGSGGGECRYRMHDLIRVYAHERCQLEEPLEDQRAAVSRLLDCWLGLLARAVASRPTGVTGGLPASPAPAVVLPEELDRDPIAWLAVERAALVAIVERAATLELDQAACDLAALLSSSSFRLDNAFDEWWRTHEVALAAARRAGNRHGEATLLVGLGQLRYEQDDYTDAARYFHDGLQACRLTGDPALEAAALAGLGEVCREQGQLAEARNFLERARAAFTAAGHRPGIAATAYGLGVVHRETGHFPAAQAAFGEALTIHEADGALRGQGLCLRAIGLVHRATGELEYAAELFEQALTLLRRAGDELAEAYGLQALAKVHIRQGRCSEARGPLAHALDVCRRLKDRFGEALILRTLGELELADRSPEMAIPLLSAALAGWDELGQPAFRARTLRDLADALALRGDLTAASATRAEAIELFDTLGCREYAELSGQQRGAEPPPVLLRVDR